MSVLYLMVPMSLALGFGFFAAFYWAVRQGQFDDVETPALRILEDSPQERKLHGKKHSQI
ncbi:MAG: cbb3-type cytochrome oxidase assembly protein CcoS [Bdellovibrionales bacterium]|jgi:cbb3-type cytochrome oxidase maturation protein|nr:cbb3-type cytochrome oxidase assembly protein CcoS [Bdellovibrionales bacterium]MBL7670814.1 cbb3-type cytochrome oxidase assembly protein CcoS [Pseudobdellovibrionaceae bacterium]